MDLILKNLSSVSTYGCPSMRERDYFKTLYVSTIHRKLVLIMTETFYVPAGVNQFWPSFKTNSLPLLTFLDNFL